MDISIIILRRDFPSAHCHDVIVGCDMMRLDDQITTCMLSSTCVHTHNAVHFSSLSVAALILLAISMFTG